MLLGIFGVVLWVEMFGLKEVEECFCCVCEFFVE